MENTIEHEGIVVDVTTSCIKVNVLASSACVSCQAKKMCSAADQKDKTIEILFQQSYSSIKIGDQVCVQAKSGNGWWAIFLSYIFPTIILAGIIAIGVLCLNSEVIATLLGLAGTGAYFGFLYLFRGKLQQRFTFSIVQKEDE